MPIRIHKVTMFMNTIIVIYDDNLTNKPTIVTNKTTICFTTILLLRWFIINMVTIGINKVNILWFWTIIVLDWPPS